MSKFFVYLLESATRTYIGATVDLDHRLKQHNGELAGGAKATRGRKWIRICAVTGFPDWRTALQFEWAWKFQSRRIKNCKGLAQRFQALLTLIQLDKPTNAALPYVLWPDKITLVYDAKLTKSLEKIESFSAICRFLGPAAASFQPSNVLPSFFQRTSFKMSTIAELSTLITALTKQVEEMSTELADLREFKSRLATVMGGGAAAAEPKKRGRKAKAAGGAGDDASSDGKKPRKARAKAECPAAAAGVIRFFKASEGEYRCFSNFFKAPITIDEKEYRSVENYFQSQRFVGTDDDYSELIRNKTNSALCRAMGKSKEHPARADWDDVKNEIMFRGLLAKFQTHPELATTLEKTGDALIEEENPADDYWGIGKDGKGANMMGKALMRVRQALRGDDDDGDDDDDGSDSESDSDDEEAEEADE